MADEPIELPGQTPAPLSENVLQARDLLIEFMREHRRICEDGPDCGMAGGLIAYIAHCIGVNQADVTVFYRELLRYDMECPHADGEMHSPADSG